MSEPNTSTDSMNKRRLAVRAIGFPGAGGRRDVEIDALKGYAILLVVLGHCLLLADPGVFKPTASFGHILFWLIYSFHMGLFMFLSGMTAFGRPVDVPRSFLRLVVPNICWLLLIYLSEFGTLSGIGRYTYRAFIFTENPLWFLFTLFLCRLLLLPAGYVKRFKYGEEAYLFCALVAINAIPTRNLGLGDLKYYFAFFALGYLYTKHKEKLAELPVAAGRALLGAGTALYALVFVIVYPSLTLEMSAGSISDFLRINVMRFWLAILGIVATFAVLTAVEFVRGRAVVSALAWLGLATLDIYVAHTIFMQLSFGTGWVKVVSAFVFSTAACLALTYGLLRNWRLLSYPLLGRSYLHGPRYTLRAPESEAAPEPALPASHGLELTGEDEPTVI